MTCLDDRQRGNKFLFPEALPARRRIGQRRQCLDYVMTPHEAAIVGFHAPDRQDSFTIDTVAVFDDRKNLAVLLQHLAAFFDPRV